MSTKARRRIWAQWETARDEGEREGTGPNGAKHEGLWLTPPGHGRPRKRGRGEERSAMVEIQTVRTMKGRRKKWC